ncbi:MAG: hypothetical protein ACI91Z_001590 [Yoonia sp.]|jgi:hypothetical protein
MRNSFATLELAPSKPKQKPHAPFGTRLRIGHGDPTATFRHNQEDFRDLYAVILLKIVQIQPILVVRLPLMAPQRLLEV